MINRFTIMNKRNVNIIKRIKLKHLYKLFVRQLKLYLTRNEKLTGRQRLTKLRIETLLSYILLVVLLLLGLQYIYIYYEIHNAIHIENITFPKTGYTSISCYSNYKGTNLCCADNPYLITSLINNSRKPFGTYECYKFQLGFLNCL